ncbi:MAG: Fe-S cluster assembly protein SufB [Candidatus Kerfeldbacteria bacterium]
MTGPSADVVRSISVQKHEPEWVTASRLKSLAAFRKCGRPSWGPSLTGLRFGDLKYYLKPIGDATRSWRDVPRDVKRAFDRMGVPQAERKLLAGVGAQFDSEMIYHRYRDALRKLGVVFSSMEDGVREHPEIVRRYFGTLVPAHDNPFAALNSAAWSGGSFIYVPKGVTVAAPLSAFFMINAERLGQFERTLIIADDDSSMHYIEGCTAPRYSAASLHAGVVEIFVGKRAKVRYTTMQNWSRDVYNLVTKRARVEEEGVMEWIDGNIGSRVTMKYPGCLLVGRKAHGSMLSLSLAGTGQHQDTGARMVHGAPETTSVITSKSVAKQGGRTSFRGLVRVARGARSARSHMRCDSLLIDPRSSADSYPTVQSSELTATVSHEATVGKLGDEQLFYLRSRGLTEAEASAMIVNGFIEPIVKELPMEYAAELNRLISMEMEKSVA